MVSTLDSESSDPSSNLGGTFLPYFLQFFLANEQVIIAVVFILLALLFSIVVVVVLLLQRWSWRCLNFTGAF